MTKMKDFFFFLLGGEKKKRAKCYETAGGQDRNGYDRKVLRDF